MKHAENPLIDRQLLHEEPFFTLFCARSVSGQTRSEARASEPIWLEKIIQALRDTPGKVEAVRAWLENGFPGSISNADEVDMTNVSKEDQMLEVFVRFYWLVYQEDDEKAMVFLQKHRDKAYMYAPSSRTISLAQVSQTDSQGAKRQLRKRGNGGSRKRPHDLGETVRGLEKNTGANGGVPDMNPQPDVTPSVVPTAELACFPVSKVEKNGIDIPLGAVSSPPKSSHPGHFQPLPITLAPDNQGKGYNISTAPEPSTKPKRRKTFLEESLSYDRSITSSDGEALLSTGPTSKDSVTPSGSEYSRASGSDDTGSFRRKSSKRCHPLPRVSSATTYQESNKKGAPRGSRDIGTLNKGLPTSTVGGSTITSLQASSAQPEENTPFAIPIGPNSCDAGGVSAHNDRNQSISQADPASVPVLYGAGAGYSLDPLPPPSRFSTNLISAKRKREDGFRSEAKNLSDILFVEHETSSDRPLPSFRSHPHSHTVDISAAVPSYPERMDDILPSLDPNSWVDNNDLLGNEIEWSDLEEQDLFLDLCSDSKEPAINPVQTYRPILTRTPPIWAKSRQEVCESLEWFRSYHSGVYHINGIVKGYLLSAFASSRDIFHHDGKLIISHGGGKSESIHSRDGQLGTQEAQDQLAQDKSVRALLNNHNNQRPLVLLIDDKYTLFPYDLSASGYTYVVLGFYRIIHAWAEYQPANNEQGRVVRYKFAFQWCEEQGNPWWISKRDMPTGNQCQTQSIPSKISHIPAPSWGLRFMPTRYSSIVSSDLRYSKVSDIYFSCASCKSESPHVYEQGQMCLNPICSAFWVFPNNTSPLATLEYTQDFLQLLPRPTHPPTHPAIADIRPRLPVRNPNGITTSYSSSRGWHCKACGRLSSRFKWEHWECQVCQAIHKIEGRIRTPDEFWRQLPELRSRHELLVAVDSGIAKAQFKILSGDLVGGHLCYQTYILPHDRGKIHIILGNTKLNLSANRIFRQYQEQAKDGRLLFRRYPLRSHKLRGPLLANYFSQNSGEPYQYIGGTANTVPFDGAPEAVLGALELIKQRIREALPTLSPNFNEVLSAGYMEKQRMAFHSDAEKGLGPLVASLSLGSAAVMHFRLHARFEAPRERGCSRNVLSLILRHGDVLVMEGKDVQTCYEHTVVPVNFRIAATARYIDPKNHPA